MVDLKKSPFNLNDSQINWVEETINSMTLDEKIGQLFVLLKAVPGVDEEKIKKDLSVLIRVAFVGKVEIMKLYIIRIHFIRRQVRHLSLLLLIVMMAVLA